VCRVARRSGKLFGDLQLIMVLDPKQLPPVEDKFYGDSGEYSFQSPLWPKVCYR
jgi:hypothetical protein